jgi:hypothetical protein
MKKPSKIGILNAKIHAHQLCASDSLKSMVIH